MLFVTTALPDAFEWMPVVNSIVIWGAVAGGVIKYLTWRATEEERKRKRAEELRTLIVNVCETFTNSESYRKIRDERTREVAGAMLDEAFRNRAASFVDSKVYASETDGFRDDIKRLGDDIKENTRTLSEINGKLSTLVFREPQK